MSTNTLSALSGRTGEGEAEGFAARPWDSASLGVEPRLPQDWVVGPLMEVDVDVILGDAHKATGLNDLPA
jgi:hypothetical protein